MAQQSGISVTLKGDTKDDTFEPDNSFEASDDTFEPAKTSTAEPIQGTPSFDALSGVKYNPKLPPAEEPAQPEAESPETNKLGLWDRIYGSVMNAPEFITKPVHDATQKLLEPSWDPQATETGNIREAQLRGFIGGATRAASQMLSPANIISTLGGGTVPRILTKLIGTAQITQGGRELLHGSVGKGLMDVGFGTLGLALPAASKGERLPTAEPTNVTPAERLPVTQAPAPKAPPIIDVQPVAPNPNIHSVPEPTAPTAFAPLPTNLRGAKPRFNMGKTSYTPQFESDLDKALFIIAQKTKSKQDAQYLKYVMDTLGTDEANARALGQMVRKQLKTILKGQPSGTVKIPQIHANGEFTGGMPTAPVPEATVTPRVAQPTPRTSRTVNPDNSGIPELGIVGDEPDAQGNWWDWMRRSRGARSGDVDVSKLDNPIAKLIVKLRQSRILNEEQKKIYRRELGKKYGNMENAEGATATERAANRGAARTGGYERVSFDPLELHPDEIEYLHQAVEDAGLNQLEMARAGDAIVKLQHGEVPQPNEVKLLSSIFTNKLTRDLKIPRAQASNISSQFTRIIDAVSPMSRSETLEHEIDALSRDLLSSTDFSGPGKQGLPLALTKEWRESWKPAVKAVGSRAVFEAEQLAHQGIDSAGNVVDAEANRLYKIAQKGGLALSDVETTSRHEEGFLGSILNELPGTDKLKVNYPKTAKVINAPGSIVRGSERGYSAFLNKLRMDYFKRLYTGLEKYNSTQPDHLKYDMVEASEKISEFINTVTGRGKLQYGKYNMEKYSQELNHFFFAPRLQARNWQMLTNPWFYINQPDYLRKEAIKAGLTLAGTIAGANALGAIAGGKTNLTDPSQMTSSKYGRIGFGNTYLDPGAGELQLVTALARLAANGAITASGKHVAWNKGYNPRNDFTTIVDLLTSKAAPMTSLKIKGLKGVDYEGKPVSMPMEAIKSFIPISIQDTHAVLQSDPDLMIEWPKDKRALAAIPFTFFGGGATTYSK